MFGFLKNTAVSFTTDDLDKCLDYLSKEIVNAEKENKFAQIVNTITTYIDQISNGKVQLEAVCQHFRNLKTDCISQKGLQNHRDIDYSSYYVLSSFFLFLSTSNLEASKNGLRKILIMCQDNVEPALRNHVKSIVNSLIIALKL